MAFCAPLHHQLLHYHSLTHLRSLSAFHSTCIPLPSSSSSCAIKPSVMVRAASQTANAAALTEDKKQQASATKACSPLQLTYLEGNSWLWSVLGMQILVDPVLVGNLDFGIPWLYDAAKKELKEFQEDDLRARCHKSSSVVDKERFKENELTEKISVLQATKQNEDKAIIPVGTASAATLALAVAGLISCSQAWAGPEIASVQDAASWLGDLDDIKSGFLSAFLLIFFSEIGDKTFFIAAVLASRKSNAAVFTGTFGALVAMTFISVFLGRTFHYIDGILPFSLGENELPLDDLAAVILLVYFGISTLLEAASMEGSKAEEEQQEAELAIAGLGVNGKGSAITNTALATFGLVFVAEWGDKSFFSTVALSAASSPVGVVSGAIAGHGVATLLAVLGGSLLSSYISEKVTAYIGGSLFLIFAAFTLYEIVS